MMRKTKNLDDYAFGVFISGGFGEKSGMEILIGHYTFFIDLWFGITGENAYSLILFKERIWTIEANWGLGNWRTK